jgi:ribonuclease HI
MVMFCDGSAHTDALGGGGVGLLLYKGGELATAATSTATTTLSIPTGLLSTNSSTECFGILALTSKAITLTQQGSEVDNFHIVSDSQTYVNMARAGKAGKDGNYWHSIKRIESMKRTLRSRGKRWVCWWSPGHVGNRLNDIVDNAAKQGATLSRTTMAPLAEMKKPYQLVKSFIRRRLNARYQQWWNTTEHARTTFQCHPLLDKKIPKELTSGIKRRHQIILSKARMGNVNTNSSRHLYGLLPHPYCDHCENIEDSFDHRIFDCAFYKVLRWKMKRKLRLIQVDLPFSRNTFLILEGVKPKNRKSVVRIFCKFFEDTKLDDFFFGITS